MERKKNHDKYIYRCIANRIAHGSCEGNCIGEDAVRQVLLEQLLQYKEILAGELNALSIEPDSLPELSFIEMELSYMQNITRTLYENLVNGVLTDSEYIELKRRYKGETDKLKQRDNILRKTLDDKKDMQSVLHESLFILNLCTNIRVLAREHTEQLVERIEVYRNGNVHVVSLQEVLNN